MFETLVPLLGFAERLRIEINIAEHTFQLRFVCLFDLIQRDVDSLANVGLVALFERIKVTSL